MLSLIIALVGGIVADLVLQAIWNSPGWNAFFSVLVFLVIWVLINLRLNKRLEKIFKGVQEHISTAQEKVRREAQMWQQKGMGGPKLQERIEEKLKAAIREALTQLDAVEPLRRWNWLAGRQADTMKAQLLYQIRDYAAADPLLDKALMFDPAIVAMKMARDYQRGNREKVEKAYKTGVRRFKGDKGSILYALYSWILVKENRIEEAVVVLDQGKLKTDSPVLKENWQHLVNGQVKQFSNAGLNELWYMLNLEEQKQMRIRQQPSPFGMPGGRHRR